MPSCTHEPTSPGTLTPASFLNSSDSSPFYKGTIIIKPVRRQTKKGQKAEVLKSKHTESQPRALAAHRDRPGLTAAQLHTCFSQTGGSELQNSCDMIQKEEMTSSHQYNLSSQTKRLGSWHWEQACTLFCLCVEFRFNKTSWAADKSLYEATSLLYCLGRLHIVYLDAH